jgi:hypothetical protein
MGVLSPLRIFGIRNAAANYGDADRIVRDPTMRERRVLIGNIHALS